MQRPYTAQCAADATLSVRTSLPSFIERVCVSVCDCAVYSLLWSHPGWIFTCDEDCSCCLLHNGYRCLKTAKNKFSWCDLTNFSKNFLHYFRFRIILIFCQTVKGKCIYQSISRLFLSNFWWVFEIWPNCVLLPAASRQKLPSYTHWSVFFCRKLLKPLSLGRTVLYNFHAHYDNTGCRGFKRGVQNWKDCCLKINIPKGNYWILRIGVMGRCQKLGIILENKVI